MKPREAKVKRLTDIRKKAYIYLICPIIYNIAQTFLYLYIQYVQCTYTHNSFLS